MNTPLERGVRWRALNARGATLWFTGLSGAGKSTIAIEVERALIAAGVWTYRLDGDVVRDGLNRGLGFSDEDRAENLRRISEVAGLIANGGALCIVSTISPLQTYRDAARQRHQQLGIDFFEIYISTPVGVCRQRDPKGLYHRADAGLLPGFTGVSAPYEPPAQPDLTLPAHELSIARATTRCLQFIADQKLVDRSLIESCPPPPSDG